MIIHFRRKLQSSPQPKVIWQASWRKRNRRVFSLFLISSILLLGLILSSGVAYGHFPFLIHLTPPQPRKTAYQLGEPVSITLNIQNVSPVSFETPLCVREIVRRRSYHLGCVPKVSFAPFNDGSRFTFEVTRPAHLPGRHLVIFSYQDLYGHWHEIMDSGHHLLRASYWVN